MMSLTRYVSRWALFQWQIKLVILQNIQQRSYLIILFITLLLLLLLLKIPLSSTPQPPHRIMDKESLYLCLMFPPPPLGKSLSFGDLNVVIVDLTSPFAYYPNISWRCCFYDFLARLLLGLEFYSQKKCKFFSLNLFRRPISRLLYKIISDSFINWSLFFFHSFPKLCIGCWKANADASSWLSYLDSLCLYRL